MHLVFLNQYYPPDAAPTGVMLEAVAEECARQGHEVTVICAAGGYAGGVVNVEHRTSNVEHRRGEIVDEERLQAGSSAGSPNPPTTDHRPRTTGPSPTILRLGATRFGRGSFVGKVLDYASYYLGVAWRLSVMRPRPDRIVALTTPPYLSVLARMASGLRGGDHAHWVMDLYPDVMAAHGMLRETGLAYRALAGLARWGFGGRRGAAVLTLGPDMAERCAAVMGGRGQGGPPEATGHGPRPPVSWIPLWGEGGGGRCSGAPMTVADFPGGTARESQAPESESFASHLHSAPMGTSATVADAPLQAADRPLRRQRGWADDELVVMYSGNMGLGHRFGEILELAGEGGDVEHRTSNVEHRTSNVEHSTSHIPQSNSIRFVFYGGGKRRGEIEAFLRGHPGAAVELHDYAPAAILPEHLRSADVHLASLDADWTGTMVPSKLQGIFAVGRPVVFIGGADSSIGRWVTESGGGWVVAPGDVDGVRRALEEARDPAIRSARGAAAERFAARVFDKAANVARVAEMFCK